jgi:hypothetical protein
MIQSIKDNREAYEALGQQVSQLLVAIRAELQHAELESAKEMEPKVNKLVVCVPLNVNFASTYHRILYQTIEENRGRREEAKGNRARLRQSVTDVNERMRPDLRLVM